MRGPRGAMNAQSGEMNAKWGAIWRCNATEAQGQGERGAEKAEQRNDRERRRAEKTEIDSELDHARQAQVSFDSTAQVFRNPPARRALRNASNVAKINIIMTNMHINHGSAGRAALNG